jgi:hypothetical protein
VTIDLGQRQIGAAGIFDCIGDQIGDQRLDPRRIAVEHHRFARRERDVLAAVGEIVDHGLGQRAQIERAPHRLLAGVAHIGERGRDQSLHVADVALARTAQIVGCLLEPQPEPHQRGAQIVRNRADHGGAIVDIAVEPRLHRVERGRGFGDLSRPFQLERRGTRIAPQPLGGGGKGADRLGETVRQRPGEGGDSECRHEQPTQYEPAPRLETLDGRDSDPLPVRLPPGGRESAYDDDVAGHCRTDL